jgi:WhiB family transcriptional regulator, redox-sensing transcriptional regulator
MLRASAGLYPPGWCGAWALELGAASGIWGGTTEDERRALRRAAARHRNRARKTAIHE